MDLCVTMKVCRMRGLDVVIATILFGVAAAPTSSSAAPAAPVLADELPDVRSESVVVLDSDTGAELFGKAADEIRPIASTTKIFVAMAVRARGIDLDGWTKITRVDAKQARGGSRTRLDVGEKFRNRDLLRAMLMASDNRAPTALGRAVGLDPAKLVAAMNKVARSLHLKRTKFTHPSGLRGNVSTAREMALALRAALEDRVLRQIMGDDHAVVYSKDRYPKIGYGNTNRPLIARRYHVVGGKTGYTKSAGYCFITAARFHGRELLTVFLGAPAKKARFDDFNRVAAWLERGAPGAKIATKRPKRKKPRLDFVDVGGRVAKP